jgi:hypothetical protein
VKSHTTERFRKALALLPSEVRVQARDAYRLFQSNPRHPGLRFKRVHSRDPIYSVRVSLDYRAVGVVEADEIFWFWIGSHAEYDRLLRTL